MKRMVACLLTCGLVVATAAPAVAGVESSYKASGYGATLSQSDLDGDIQTGAYVWASENATDYRGPLSPPFDYGSVTTGWSVVDVSTSPWPTIIDSCYDHAFDPSEYDLKFSATRASLVWDSDCGLVEVEWRVTTPMEKSHWDWRFNPPGWEGDWTCDPPEGLQSGRGKGNGMRATPEVTGHIGGIVLDPDLLDPDLTNFYRTPLSTYKQCS